MSWDKKIPDNIQKKAKHIVDKSPKLKALKSASQGEKSLFHGAGRASDGGKGSAPRPGTHSQQFKDNFDKINWGNRLNTNKSFRVKVNGVYLDEDDDV